MVRYQDIVSQIPYNANVIVFLLWYRYVPKGQDCCELHGDPAGAWAVPPEVAWLERAFLLTAGKANRVASQDIC